MNSSSYAAAYRAHRAAPGAAPQFTDPRLSPDEITRERGRKIKAAKAALTAATPSAPTSRGQHRETVLSATTARTADDIAAQAREWRKVTALLDAKRSLPQIIAAASRERVAAILDQIETMPAVLESNDPEAVAGELRTALFDRLVELREPDAIAAVTAETADATQAAWSQALTEAQTGNVGLDARQALYTLDRAGYDAAFTDDIPVDHTAVYSIERDALRL